MGTLFILMDKTAIPTFWSNATKSPNNVYMKCFLSLLTNNTLVSVNKCAIERELGPETPSV